MRLLAVPGGPVISKCSPGKERERALHEHVFALHERTAQLLEEGA